MGAMSNLAPKVSLFPFDPASALASPVGASRVGYILLHKSLVFLPINKTHPKSRIPPPRGRGTGVGPAPAWGWYFSRYFFFFSNSSRWSSVSSPRLLIIRSLSARVGGGRRPRPFKRSLRPDPRDAPSRSEGPPLLPGVRGKLLRGKSASPWQPWPCSHTGDVPVISWFPKTVSFHPDACGRHGG